MAGQVCVIPIYTYTGSFIGLFWFQSPVLAIVPEGYEKWTQAYDQYGNECTNYCQTDSQKHCQRDYRWNKLLIVFAGLCEKVINA